MLQTADQIKGFATRCGQLQGIPTRTDDEVGLAARVGQEAFQHRHTGEFRVADADFARCRHASIERLRAGWLTQVPSARRNVRPGQRSLAPGAAARAPTGGSMAFPVALDRLGLPRERSEVEPAGSRFNRSENW